MPSCTTLIPVILVIRWFQKGYFYFICLRVNRVNFFQLCLLCTASILCHVASKWQRKSDLRDCGREGGFRFWGRWGRSEEEGWGRMNLHRRDRGWRCGCATSSDSESSRWWSNWPPACGCSWCSCWCQLGPCQLSMNSAGSSLWPKELPSVRVAFPSQQPGG